MTTSFVLVTTPILGEFRSVSVLGKQARQVLSRPSLGPLVVASLLRRAGIEPQVFDLDRFWVRHCMDLPVESRLEQAAVELARQGARWVGFSTICSSYHLTLRLAQKLKALQPEVRIVLGGPQASATAADTLSECPYIDFVLRGEVEETLGLFLALAETNPEQVPGLAYRQGRTVCQNGAPVPPGSSLIPPPAYDLWAEGPIPVLPLEAGRGCPYGCRFCSTSPFFGRRFRTRDASLLLAECQELVQRYQSTEVCLINDHIAVDRGFLQALCEGWRNNPVLRPVPFSCSLRPDSATDDVVDLLASSGCKKVFIGVETGSQRLQPVVGKNVKVDRVLPLVDLFRSRDIHVAVSFIAGFPEESEEDLGETLALIERLLPRSNALPLLGVLSPLAGSQYLVEYADRLEFDPDFSAQSMHNLAMDEAGVLFIRQHVRLCSADYSFPLRHLNRHSVAHLARFHRYIGNRLRFPALAAAKTAGGMQRLFDLWRTHLEESGAQEWGESYYASRRFVTEFLTFLNRLPHTSDTEWGQVLEAVLGMQEALNRASDCLAEPPDSALLVVTEESWLAPGPHLAYSPTSPTAVAEALVSNRLPSHLFQPTWLQVSPVPMEQLDPNGNAPSEWELEVHEPGPLAQQILHFCNPPVQPGPLLNSLANLPLPGGVPGSPERWLVAVQTMLEQGLLTVAPQ